MLKLSFLDKLPYVFLRNKNYKNGGNNKMAKPSFQNLRNKMFAPLSNDLSSFIGQTNYISKDIPEVQVALSSFMLNQDDDNMAYNLRNMYGGNPLGHVMNEVTLPLQRAFHLVREEFYVGIDINRIEDYNEITGDPNVSGQRIYNYIGQKLANRLGLIRERNLAKVVQDTNLYDSSSTVDLSGTAMSSWTESNVGELFEAVVQLTLVLNKNVGGTLYNDQMEAQDMLQNLFIVMPAKVYTKFVGIFAKFKDYITALGTTSDGKYKSLRPALFDAVTGGKTKVATAFRVKEDKEIDTKYQIANLEDLWTENAIYLFTASSNLDDFASVKEFVKLRDDTMNMEILGNNLWRNRTQRGTFANNPNAFMKITLNVGA